MNHWSLALRTNAELVDKKLPVIVGVDPGETTGICVVQPRRLKTRTIWTCETVQCSAGMVVPIVFGILRGHDGAEERDGAGERDGADLVLAIERFVVGPRSARSSSAAAGQTTRDLIGELSVPDRAWRTFVRTASQVKLWATDTRLDAAGLLKPTKTARHARDAARQALYSSVADLGFPDPLSKSRMGGE